MLSGCSRYWQPVSTSAWFLCSALKLFVESELYKHLLAWPHNENGEPQDDKDVTMVPHLQTIFYYLVDPSRDGPEVRLDVFILREKACD